METSWSGGRGGLVGVQYDQGIWDGDVARFWPVLGESDFEISVLFQKAEKWKKLALWLNVVHEK